MAKNEVDTIDLIGIVAFPIAAGLVFGVWSFSLNLFGGFDLSQVMYSAAGVDITAATLVALGSLVWIVGTNQIDGSDYEDFEYGIIAVAFLSVPMYEFVPAFASLVDYHDAFKLGMFLLASVASAYIAYTE